MKTTGQRASVVKRTLVHDEGSGNTFRICIPNHATLPKHKLLAPYVQFPQKVGNGFVNIVVYDIVGNDPIQMRGQQISVTLQYYEKILSNGRKFPFVEVRRIKDTVPTHQFQVTPRDIILDPALRVYPMPPPLYGSFVIAPINTELRFNGRHPTAGRSTKQLMHIRAKTDQTKRAA